MVATFLIGWLLLDVMVEVVSGIGPCTVNVTTVDYFDFDEFARYNDGIWPFRMIPDIERYQNMTWGFQSYNRFAAQGVYTVRVYRQMGEGPTEWHHHIRFNVDLAGVIVGKLVHSKDLLPQPSDYDTYYFKLIAYEPGRYAFFYDCSDLATDTEYDYRFVLGECLCEEEKGKIMEIDQSYEFKGCLRDL